MFGMSWDQIIIILVVGLFLLGPERIPTVVQWVGKSLRQMRTMATGAQAQLQSELGPEIAELRKQVAELQSLREVAHLRELRDLHPRRVLASALMGDENATLPKTMTEFLDTATGPVTAQIPPTGQTDASTPNPPAERQAATDTPVRRIQFDPEGT